MENSETFNIFVYVLSVILSTIIIIVFFVMANALKNISRNIKIIKDQILDLSNEKDLGVKKYSEIEQVSKEDAKSITIKNIENRKVETISMEYWEQMKKLYGEDKYEIIKYHK